MKMAEDVTIVLGFGEWVIGAGTTGDGAAPAMSFQRAKEPSEPRTVASKDDGKGQKIHLIFATPDSAIQFAEALNEMMLAYAKKRGMTDEELRNLTATREA